MVLAHVDRTHVVEVVPEGVVQLTANAGHRLADLLESSGGVPGQAGQPLGTEDEQGGERQDDGSRPSRPS